MYVACNVDLQQPWCPNLLCRLSSDGVKAVMAHDLCTWTMQSQPAALHLHGSQQQVGVLVHIAHVDTM